LNQIEKAYGEYNSVLDNCHVRVAFATNDERTAKRISDALGTATEQRAMRNYAGHRLAPWLAHVMVSRQETARQLLTPGEVMQLSPDEEIVLVSGLAPIRARKLRYFRDRNFTARVAPAPKLAQARYADCPKPRGDDWSDQVRGIDARLHQADDAAGGEDDGGMQQQRHPGLPEQPAKSADAAETHDPQLVPDDDDVAADKRAMDQSRGLSAVARGYAINEGAHRDLNLYLDREIGDALEALAAGNRALLKPSELTPRTSAVLKRLLEDAFTPEEVAVVLGGPEVGAAFSALPFDHLLFTGSTPVGRRVMAAASENLVPVTLELGGKSPAVIARGHVNARTLGSLVFGKLANAGQTCVAPDYALVHEDDLETFVGGYDAAVARAYPEGPTGADYTSIVNERHFE
ncbi:hypothetical protein LTR94_027092, partial [Friedmanniomyces endolithicus]